MGAARRTVAFRVDASREIGTGHVMRCLALADGLHDDGADAIFVCREHEGHLIAAIAERGYRVIALPSARHHEPAHEQVLPYSGWLGADWHTDADETVEALRETRLDWLVVDHYAIDARWEERVRSVADRILVIDDLANRPHTCDALLDQNLVAGAAERYQHLVPPRTRVMTGPAYALLRQEYQLLRSQAAPRRGPVRRVLVSFGGVDQHGLTLVAVQALLAIKDAAFEVDVVLSAAASDYDSIAHLVANRPEFRLHDRVASLAPMMLAADLMIGSSGTTSWERLCLGLPAIVVTAAENQRASAEELDRRGLVRWLGDADKATEAALRAALGEIMTTGLDGEWSRRCSLVVDGGGIDRVRTVLGAHRDMPLCIRAAGSADEALLLEWANDPLTRRQGFNAAAISADGHRTWFRQRLARPAECVICIAQTEAGIPLGQVRFERRDGKWEISYALSPVFRGVGLGRPMLRAAIARFRGDHPDASLFALVKLHNVASRRIFEALGFHERPGRRDHHLFERDFREQNDSHRTQRDRAPRPSVHHRRDVG